VYDDLFGGNFATFKRRIVHCYGVTNCSFLSPHTRSWRLFLAENNFGHLDCRVVGSKNFPGCGVMETKILHSCVGIEPWSFSLRPVSCFMINKGLFNQIVSHTWCILTLDMDWKNFGYRAVWILLGSNVGLVKKSWRMRWAGHVARTRERRGVYRVLVGKPEGKRPLERPDRKWEDNIKSDL
jgi:hypothetical protein